MPERLVKQLDARSPSMVYRPLRSPINAQDCYTQRVADGFAEFGIVLDRRDAHGRRLRGHCCRILAAQAHTSLEKLQAVGVLFL